MHVDLHIAMHHPLCQIFSSTGALPLNTDRLYRPDDTLTRGKWGTAVHINEDAKLKSKLNERGFVIEDGFFVAPGHGGATEILWSHDGSRETFSGAATVIDCIDYCGGAGTVEFTIKGDGRDLWNSGLVRHGDPARPFSVPLDGIREIRLVITDGGNGVDEDWGGWLNLKIGASGADATTTAAGTTSTLPPATTGVSPTLTIPVFDSGDTTKAIFVINSENGRARVIDHLRRTSAEVRERPFHDNVFNALGRPLDLPAHNSQLLAGPIRKGNGAVHALLLVDTTTGAMGYITGLGDDPSKARLKRISGLPAQDMAGPDGNFSLIMRRNASGETVGAYLFRGTTGRCVYFRDLEKLPTHIDPTPTSSLPAIDGPVSSLALQGGSDATTHFLLIDNEGGALFLVGGVKRKAAQLTVQPIPSNLVSSFPTETPVAAPIRFVPIPITTRSGATDSALILDVAGGAMAILEHLTEPSKTRLIGVNRSIYGLLPADVGSPRSITAVPKINDTGTTVGAWLFDSASDTILFLANLDHPNQLELRTVRVGN
ncbi:MAG: NPCBM/NEW2 domain-containing protein [Acidobacteriota bacterium]